jgi:gluconate 2-dehydrogenase gamma chain
MSKNTLPRRKFIQMAAVGAGSLLLFPMCTRKSSGSVWRFFTEEEANSVIAIAEQFIPADKDPGATYANVVIFIDKQLVGPYTRFQDEYRTGLACFSRSCKAMHNNLFPALEWKKQTEFLELMEKGKLAKEYWGEINQSSFFSKLLDHSMQGFYGSPRHGGNRDYVSYKMMKLDYPHVIGQNRYTAVVEQIKNEKHEK